MGRSKRFEVNWCPLFYSPYVFNMGYIHLSVQFSSVKSLSHVQLFVTHGPQHARPPCPSPTHGVYPNSCPLSRWCHSTISFSVVPFSSCLQSYLASRSFQMSQLFASGGQSIGTSASTAVLPMNIQCWFCLEWTSLGISNFLDEISSLSHFVVFLYFFALVTEEGFLISSWYSLELCIQMLISFWAPQIIDIIHMA